MIDAQELDDALRTGSYRLGSVNRRPVKCAGCNAECPPSQAQRVHLRGRWYRDVMLCLGGCLPKHTTNGRVW